jgi:uncharacterized protein YdaU (DUF1376 family)
MNYYPFHVGDYVLATRHLGLLEDLCYRRLLDLAYTSEAPIDDAPERISRLIGMRDHSEIVSDILSEFFLKSDAGWIHKRAQKEIEKYRKKSASANAANEARWAKSAAKKIKPNRRKSEIRSETDPNQNHNHNQNQSNIPPNPPAGGNGFDWFSELPPELDTEEFRRAWTNWVSYRHSIKKPLNPASAPAAFRKALEVGVDAAIRGFDTAMANGWQGAFPVATTPIKHDHRSEKRSREFSEQLEVPDIV